MKYAFWKLKQEEPNYLSGPEQTIFEAGGRAEASFSNGQVETGATILGYVFGDFSADLDAWNYQETTQQEAFDFVLAINPNAFLSENGKIAIPKDE